MVNARGQCFSDRCTPPLCEYGGACLPVHDSFIVHHGYEEDLRNKMRELFLSRYGSAPSLKDKGVIFYRSDTPTRDTLDVQDILAALDTRQDHRLDAFRVLKRPDG